MVQILDVGCGDRPKGTVNLDRYKNRTEHLEAFRGRVNPQKTLNFVQGVIEHLPFKDDGVDVIRCYHTLEHLENPEEGIKEMVRVARNHVEIVVPFRYHEIIQSWFLPFRRRWMLKYHKWFFDKAQLQRLFKTVKGELQIRYRYKVMGYAKDCSSHHLSLKLVVLYGLVDLLPPIPSELVVLYSKPYDSPTS